MNSYIDAVHEILEEISRQIPDAHKKHPVNAYITGGVACYLYTRARASDDIDMILSNEIKIPDNLFVPYFNEKGDFEKLVFDDTYNETLGLLHEDYEDRANLYKSINDKFKIYLLSPEDLIITKLLRFSQNDEKDITALIQQCKIDKTKVLRLADEAISVGVGFNEKIARTNLMLIEELFC